GVLVGVDAEVAEFAALAAERDVQVESQRRRGVGRRVQNGVGVDEVVGLPGREGRVVGDEVIAEAGLFLSRFGHVNTVGTRQEGVRTRFRKQGRRGRVPYSSV